MSKRSVKKVSSTDFYNLIAKQYDEKLMVAKDQLVREDLKKRFLTAVSPGSVLDFGGGTGLDLPWLIQNEYQVVFCEPAEAMRAIAKNKFSGQVKFLSNGAADFKNWEAPLVEGKFNAVLANFGVVNYIKNLPQLFEKLAQQTADDAQMFLSLLNLPTKQLYKKLPKQVLWSFLSSEPIKTGSQFEGVRHETILYKPSAIEKAASRYFDLLEQRRLADTSHFVLLHFKKR